MKRSEFNEFVRRGKPHLDRISVVVRRGGFGAQRREVYRGLYVGSAADRLQMICDRWPSVELRFHYSRIMSWRVLEYHENDLCGHDAAFEL